MAAGFLIEGEVDKPYAAARADLIKKGGVPVSQTNRIEYVGYEDLSAKYPELNSCATDQPLCRFEWKSKAGVRFYIITSSDDAPSVVVKGMDYDDPQEIKDGSVERDARRRRIKDGFC